MVQFLCFLLASYGVTNIVVASKLYQPLRDALKPVPMLGYWIQCPMCFSVPVGAGWCLVGLSPGTGLYLPFDAAASGAIASAFCWIMRVALFRLGEDEL